MACFGDSGGALICQGNLFGIISHGYNYYPGMSELNTVCGDIRVQTRHIFIYKYRQWIDNIMYANTSTSMKRNYLLLIVWFGVWFNEVRHGNMYENKNRNFLTMCDR